MRPRALAVALVVFTALVGAGALVTISFRFVEHASVAARQKATDTAPLRLVFSSGPEGAMVFFWDQSQGTSVGARVRGYAADGSMLWDAGGVEDVISADLPEAVVLKRSAADEGGEDGAATVWRVGRDGHEQELSRLEGPARLLYANSREVVYAETVHGEAGSASSKIITHDGNHPEETLIPGGGELEGVSVSANGRALAVISRGVDGNLLSWFKRSPGQGWQLAAQMSTSALYVALSPDGKQAVLGPEYPAVVLFGEGEGRRLPVGYVAQAYFGGSRVLLLDFRVEANVPCTGVWVVGLESNEIEWSRQFDAEQRVASDPNLRFLAYLEPGRKGVVVVDLSDGGERRLPVESADDVGFIDTGYLFIAHQDGAVTILRIGVER